jgi:hypothetical protein
LAGERGGNTSLVIWLLQLPVPLVGLVVVITVGVAVRVWCWPEARSPEAVSGGRLGRGSCLQSGRKGTEAEAIAISDYQHVLDTWSQLAAK